MPRRRRCCVGLRRRLVKRLPRLACRRRGLYQASIHSKMALATTSGFGQVRMSSSSRCMLDQNDSIMLATRPCCRAGQLPAAGDRRSNLCTDCRGRRLADCSGPGRRRLSDRHLNCVDDELGAHVVGDGPADDHPRVGVDHRGAVDLAGARWRHVVHVAERAGQHRVGARPRRRWSRPGVIEPGAGDAKYGARAGRRSEPGPAV